MEGRYKPYSLYKPTGIEWLGDIPNDWEVLQSRRMFAQRKERAQPDDEQLTSSQKYGIIYQKEFMELENQRVVQVITGSEILKHVEANDFVISMRSFQGGLEWCKYPGSVSSAYIGLIPQKHVVPAFFSYLFKSKQYIQALQSTSNLVRDGQALRFENFSQVPLPIISEEEQTQIAAFLDHETAQIDALIAKQQRLIVLLEEKRQAVISHAVTKGLNPNAPLEPSGVEWLGDIPKGWEATQLKRYCDVTDGSHHSPKTVDQGKPYISVSDVGNNEINLKNCKKISDQDFYRLVREGCCPKAGSLLLTKDGTIGRAAIVSEDHEAFVVLSSLGILEPDARLLNIFLFYFLLSGINIDQMNSLIHGSALKRLTISKINNLVFVLPPLPEQTQIAAFLDHETAKVDELIATSQSAITLLKERRITLISAVVTGKIDVRDWQPPKSILDQDIEATEEAVA